MGIDWGSVPDWLAGIGAVLALGFAGLAVLAARRTNQLQTDQINRLQVESREHRLVERRRMASNVAIYVATEKAPSGPVPTVWFINANPGPIYGLEIFCFTSGEQLKRKYQVNGPHPVRVRMGSLTRDLRARFGQGEISDMLDRGLLAVSCSFRDPAGLWWYRTCTGELIEAPDGATAAAAASASGNAHSSGE